jgi:hypothetical protein
MVKRKTEVMRPLTAYEVERLARAYLAGPAPQGARNCLLVYAGLRRGLRISALLETLMMGDIWDFSREKPVEWPPLHALELIAAQRWFRYLKRQHLRGKGCYGPHELLFQSQKSHANPTKRSSASIDCFLFA